MQSNIGTNKSKTNTCTGTLNDTNYHKKLSYDMCSVYQMATIVNYIIIPKPSYYYQHYLLWLLASLPRCLVSDQFTSYYYQHYLLWLLASLPRCLSAWSVYQLLLSTLFTVTTGFPSSRSSAWSVYQCLLTLPSCWSFQVTNSSAILQFQILLGLEIVIWKQ
jgi:hypothetical protein